MVLNSRLLNEEAKMRSLREEYSYWKTHHRTNWGFVYHLYHMWHMAWVDKLAARDPEWAAIEARRHDSDRSTVLWYSDEADLGHAEQEYQWKVEREATERKFPHPYFFANLGYPMHHWWRDNGPRATYRKVRDFTRRGRQGFAPSDTWGLDHYLAKLIVATVTQLRANLHGHPCDSTPEGWYEELTAIIDGYNAALAINNMDYSDKAWPEEFYPEKVGLPTHDELMAVYEKGAIIFKDRFFSLWD